ncbi:MAG: PAS domain S-box protein, partial [Bacteroidetes bacterium]
MGIIETIAGFFLTGIAGMLAVGLAMAGRDGETSAESREAERDAERFRRLLDDAPVAITLLRMDGTLIYANRAFRDLVRASEDQPLHENKLEYHVPENRSEVRRRLEAAREGQVERSRSTLLCHDGVRRIVQITSRPMTLEGEPIIHSVLADVTEL